MLNQRLRIICLYLLVVLSSVSALPHFEFNENGEFTILQFTDFHYGESEEADVKTLELQKRMLREVNPDLAIVSGDGVGGYAGWVLYIFTDNGFFYQFWRMFTDPFVEAKTYYAFTLGNHDAEGDLSAEEIVKMDKTNPYSLLKDADNFNNTANYYIPIYSKSDPKKMAANIWMFDTGNFGCGGVEASYGCIEEPQIEWYNDMSQKLKEEHGENVHHIAFIHIPLPEYQEIYNYGEIYGNANEGIACANVNTGFFDAVKANGDIGAIFAGHDHDNDFGGWYQGIELVYGRKSGWGSYGSIHGVRVIKLKETINENGESFVTREHYVIDENGKIYTTEKKMYRTGPKQLQGPHAEDQWYLVLRYLKVYDYMGIGLGILATIVFIRYQWKRNYTKKTE